MAPATGHFRELLSRMPLDATNIYTEIYLDKEISRLGLSHRLILGIRTAVALMFPWSVKAPC